MKPVFFILSFLTILASGAVVSYPRPSIYEKSELYTLKVDGTYQYTVNYTNDYDYVHLSMDEGKRTEFRISAPTQSSIKSYNISPKTVPITATTSGNELIFTVSDAHYLIITINDLKEFIVMADPTETDVPPSSGKGIFNVLDYGADATGAGITTGIQSAMDAAAKTPGSIVYVPPGLFYIGNLKLRNETSLYLAGGSVLRFTGHKNDYTTLFNKTGLLPGTWWIQTDFNTRNIKLYGRGTIDGNGYYARVNNKFMADLVVPVDTTAFVYDGPLIRDSSFWAVTPIQSTDVKIRNIKILNRFDYLEDDGIDVNESTNVRVWRAIAVSGDDTYSTKTWLANRGTTVPYPHPPQPLSDVVFDQCIAWSKCVAFKIGQGVWENQSGVIFKNSQVYNAAVGLGLAHHEGTARMRNVTYYNIDIEKLDYEIGGKQTWLAFWVDLASGGTSGVGPIEDVKVNQIRVRTLGTKNGYLHGYNESSLVGPVTLSNIYVHDATTPATTLAEMKLVYVKYTKDISIQN